MKKIVSLSVVVILLVSLLSACAATKKSEDQTKSTALQNEKVKITLWDIAVSEKPGGPISDAVERFKKDNPNVDVERVSTANDAYKDKIKIAIGSGNPPDVFYNPGSAVLEAYVKQGAVEDITEQLQSDGWAKTFFPAYLDMCKINGRYYAVPSSMNVAFVFYNKDVFRKYNVQVPKTYDEFISAIKTFKSNNIIPIALGNASKWPGALIYEYFVLRMGEYDVFQNAYQRKPGFTFADDPFIEAGKEIQKLVDMGAFPEGMNGINYDAGGSRMLIYTGRAAMIITTSGFLSNATTEAPNFFENQLGFFPFPTIEGGKGDPTDILGSVNAYAVSSKSKNKDAAVKLLKYLTDKTSGQKLLDQSAMFAPVYGININVSLLKNLFDTASSAKHVQVYYDQCLPPEMANLLNDTTQALYAKSITPEGLAQKLEEKAVEVLGKE